MGNTNSSDRDAKREKISKECIYCNYTHWIYKKVIDMTKQE
jgi:hypothetical protein